MLKFDEVVAALDLAVEGGAEGGGVRIGEIVDGLHRHVAELGLAGFGGVFLVAPVGEIEGELQAVRDAVFELVADVEALEVRVGGLVGFPGDPAFEFHGSLGHRGGLVTVGKTAAAGLGGGGESEQGTEAGNRATEEGRESVCFHGLD